MGEYFSSNRSLSVPSPSEGKEESRRLVLLLGVNRRGCSHCLVSEEEDNSKFSSSSASICSTELGLWSNRPSEDIAAMTCTLSTAFDSVLKIEEKESSFYVK
jgi:hypothetical protein